MKNIILILGILFYSSCTSDNDPCPSASHPLEDLLTSLAGSNEYLNIEGFQCETHEYTFEMNTDGILCSVGYQGNEYNQDFIIQLVDADNNVLIDESLSFSESDVSYRPVPEVALAANSSYTIRRICKNYDDNKPLEGRLLKANNVPLGISQLPLPMSFYDFKITGVNFYGNNSEYPNAIPKIYFGFNAQE